MKITTLFCSGVAFFMLLCVPPAAKAQRQDGQRVSVRLTDASLGDALKAIEAQTTYRFAYRDVILSDQRNVTVDASNENVNAVLDKILAGSNLQYSVVSDRSIVISDRQDRGAADRQSRTLSGTVADQDGNPIVGVYVMVKGTGDGTMTDARGEYRLTTDATAPVLVFRYLGYATQEIAAGSGTVRNVTMTADYVAIEATVVTALGIRRQEKALAYNVQSVASEELTTVKSANFINSLAGKIAGVQINNSGGPGGSVRVVARGEKSIEKSNSVLYVIDGVPMYNHSFGSTGGTFGGTVGSEGIADINPEDIESVNMLTGASAAALYGSQASNGVVLINTKRGVEGRTDVTVSNSTVFSRAYMMPEMQNTYGTSAGFENWGAKHDSSAFDPRDFFNTGVNLINAVSLSTGTQRNQTYISTSSTNSTGIIPQNRYDRYNFTARNTTSFLDDKMTLDLGASFILQSDRNMVSQGTYYNPLTSLYLFPRSENFDEVRIYERYDPTRAEMVQFWPYGENGSYILQNPYWIQNRMNRHTSKQRYMMNASLKYDVLDWLSVTGRARIDNSSILLTRKLYAGTNENFAGPLGGYAEDAQKDRNFYGDVMAAANKTFGDFSLSANVGASIDDKRFHSIGGAGNLKTSANEFVYHNIDFTNKFRPTAGGWNEQVQSVFASAELGWKSMLYLTATGRNEWTSQLAYTDQSNYFYPSVGLSGILSNMFNAPTWLSFLKVRGSYAEVASPFGRYLSHPGYEFNNELYVWSAPRTYPNRSLKPEWTKSWEAGLDARFFNGKLTLDMTYYRSNTYNQTIYAALPASSGYENMVVQAGNVRNEGIELALGYRNRWNGFGWATSYTLTKNRNRIIDLGTGAINPYTKEPLTHTFIEKNWLGNANVAPQVRLVEGGSMSDIYINREIKRDNDGYVDMTTGGIVIEDIDFRKVGQLSPKATMAWSNSFNYAGFDLGVIVSARLGGEVYSATQGALDYFGTSQATAAARDNGGIPVNFGMLDAQKYYQAIATPLGGYGGYYIYDATNVRLQELSLGYAFPKKWFNDKMGLSLSFIARNLAMIYCKAPFDPEISPASGSTYYQGVDLFMQPSVRELGFNVKITF